MLEKFYHFIDDAISYYSREENRDEILDAQKVYEELLGKISRDDENYDRRMASFYEWYLFEYCKNTEDKRHIEVFLEMKGGDIELEEMINSVEFSLYEYLDTSFFKKNVYKNHLTGKKFVLADDHRELFFIAEDIFLGHSGAYGEETFFLDGLSPLCRAAKKLILKEKKKVQKSNDPLKMRTFLHQVEKNNLRYQHYKHVTPDKIFHFNYEE